MKTSLFVGILCVNGCLVLDWVGMDWVRLDWTRLDLTGLGWTGLD